MQVFSSWSYTTVPSKQLLITVTIVATLTMPMVYIIGVRPAVVLCSTPDADAHGAFCCYMYHLVLLLLLFATDSAASISAAYHSLISRKCVHVKCISMSIITINDVIARIKKGNNTTSYQVVGLCMISTFINMLVQQLQLFSKFAAWGVCWRTEHQVAWHSPLLLVAE